MKGPKNSTKIHKIRKQNCILTKYLENRTFKGCTAMSEINGIINKSRKTRVTFQLRAVDKFTIVIISIVRVVSTILHEARVVVIVVIILDIIWSVNICRSFWL